MIKALLLLLIVAIGFVAGPLLSGQTGYVLIAVAGYTLETSVVVLVLALLLFIFVLWIVEWLLRKLTSGARFSLDWSRKRKRRKANQLMTSALENTLTANYEVAQRNAEDAASYHANKQQPLMLAAIVADLQNDALAKQTLIDQVAALNDGDSLIKEVADAQRASPEKAVAQMQALLKRHPQHAGIKRIAAQTFYQYDAGDALFELLPELDKHQLVPSEQRQLYKTLAYQQHFANASSIESLHQRWKGLDKKRRYQAIPRLCYASALQQKEQWQLAEKVLLKGLRKEAIAPSHLVRSHVPLSWHEQPQLYAYMHDYVKAAGRDVDALALLAKMAIQHGDFDLALQSIRSALQVQPSPELYRLLGDAYLAAGQSQPALDAYRQVTH